MDIINEFHKRFVCPGGKTESIAVPTSVCLLGIPDFPALPSVGLSLSFGAECAFRKRNDDRIIIKNSDSPTMYNINITNIDSFHGDKSIKKILNSISMLSSNLSGAELLLYCDTHTPDFSPKILCAVKALSILANNEESYRTIIKISESEPFEIASIIPSARFAIINNITLDYISYPYNFEGYKIICVKNGKKTYKKPSSGFIEREKNRINRLDTAIKNKNICELGDIIYESGRDFVAMSNVKSIENLYSVAIEFTKYLRPFCDNTGIIAVVKNEQCDEFIKVVGLKHQKKTGKKPAFYISD